jgi:hypothetical protein
MLATPWVHDPADAKRQPTDAPKPQGEDGEGHVQGMIDDGSDEELPVPAPWAVSMSFVLSHLAGKPAASTANTCRPIDWNIAPMRRISKAKLKKGRESGEMAIDRKAFA